MPSSLQGKVKDDGQRISAESVERMRAYGSAYRTKRIPVSRVVSSEYYFVWQHAEAAFGAPIDIHRDLTGSLDFSDERELEASLLGLRNRTVTPPDPGSNTVLFTHQGKFDKAYGYCPDAGTTIIVSSHVMDEAEHCERLLLLREGELIADDSPDALLRQTHTTDVESAFLELVR